MPQRTISMRKKKDIIRLQAAGLSQRQIAKSLNISKGVVSKYIKKLQGQDLSDKQWQSSLGAPRRHYKMPDGLWIYQQLKHKGVTLKLLHEEYSRDDPEQSYRYTQFCHYYKQWKVSQDLSLRQVYKAGDQLFVDYAGPTVAIRDRQTGDVRQAAIFIAAFGASQYVYVEGTWDQKLPHWIGSHVRAFEHFGGVPTLLVPDNLKQGVQKACAYDPDLNPTYAEMAAHYGTAIMPARPYKPRDKATVENSVLITERWILARLRHQVFYDLEELNHTLKDLCEQLNRKPFQKIPGCRLSQFQEVEQPALKPLPDKPYVYAVFKRQRVGKSYHVDVDKHHYSVPYASAHQDVDIRLTAHIVEVYHMGQRIACHERKRQPGITTQPLHQPEHHRRHAEWTTDISLQWAQSIGHYTHHLLTHLFGLKHHPQQQYRLFLGFTKLGRCFGDKRLEAACHQLVQQGTGTYNCLKAVLQKGLDRQPLSQPEPTTSPIYHDNIRGADYYKQGESHDH